MIQTWDLNGSYSLEISGLISWGVPYVQRNKDPCPYQG